MNNVNNNMISVIIAVYNGERYLNEAIGSVLSQEGISLELIVVDDGSTDKTAEIIKQYISENCFYHYQANQGQGAAFNKAIHMARGEYIALLDHDDLFLPNKLQQQWAFLNEHPEVDLVFGYIEHFISPDIPASIQAIRDCPKYPLPGALPSTAMFRKSCFDTVGAFNTVWKLGTHIDWMIRAKALGLREHMLPQVVARRRIHETNTSVRERKNVGDYIKVIKVKLERERALSSSKED